MQTHSLILASGSPRRSELLSLFGFPFEVIPSLADETAEGQGRDRVMSLARRKCDEVFHRVPDRYVLAADTLVCVDTHILGKPMNTEHAAQMLRLLSGRWHEVHTGVCLRAPDGSVWTEADTTRVSFIPLNDDQIRQYTATGEPMDKAGAYAIQGIAGMFIDRIDGSPSNVIGLPLALTAQMLEQAGFPLLPLPPNA